MRKTNTLRPGLRHLLLASAAACLIGGGALAQNTSPPATATSPGATSPSATSQLPQAAQNFDTTSGVTSRDTQSARDQARNARPDDDDDDDDRDDVARDIQRTIMMEAALGAMRSRLRLTSEQERLWPPAEQAVRDLARISREAHSDLEDVDDDEPVDALRRMGEAATEHGEALEKLADAAEPLWNALDDGQKRRLRRTLHAMHERMHRMHMMGGGMRGMMGGMERDHDDDRSDRRDGRMQGDMHERMRDHMRERHGRMDRHGGGWRDREDGPDRSDFRQWRKNWEDRRDRGEGWGGHGWGWYGSDRR